MKPKSLFLKANTVVSDNKMFFFHHAGGSATQYLSFFQKINAPVEVYILNLPGRSFESKSHAYIDFSILMRNVRSEIVSVNAHKIYLLGHSMGALMVYDLVGYLETICESNLLTFGISALKAPGLRFRKKKISHLSDLEFLREVESFQPFPENIKNHKEALALILETLKNDFKIIESFQSSGKFIDNKSRGFLFGGQSDSIVKEKDLLEWYEKLNFAEAPIVYPGGHFFIFQHLQQMVNLLFKET